MEATTYRPELGNNKIYLAFFVDLEGGSKMTPAGTTRVKKGRYLFLIIKIFPQINMDRYFHEEMNI